MTDIRELLREATSDLAVDHADPVGVLRRATTRRHRTWAATIAVAALVVAAIVIPLALTRGAGSTGPVAPHPTPSPAHAHAVIQVWAPDDGEVASGFGALWSLQCCGGSTAPSWVDKLNPTTGDQISEIHLPGPTGDVLTGAGRVWTFGVTDRGQWAISAIDPATSRVTTLRFPTSPDPAGFTIAQGSMWLTLVTADQVWRLTPTATGITKSVIPVSGAPTDIATTGDGAIWVERQTGNRLTHLVPTRTSGRLTQSVVWKQPIFDSPRRNRLLTETDLGGIASIDPSKVQVCVGACFGEPLHHPQVLAAVQTSRGFFFTTDRRTSFVSSGDVAKASHKPTASIPYGGASLTPDGDGVVIGGGDVGLIHWVPAP